MSKQLRQLLTPEQIDDIRAPIESARTFPREAFTSPDFQQLEFEKIYSRHWVAVAFESDIPGPGDVLPVEVCGIPVLLVRDHQGGISAFHNIVPYDGCLAVIDAGIGLDRIVTPYHGWTYNLDGRLTEIPFWDGTRAGNLESVAHLHVDLAPVACSTFLQTIFINLSERPASFDDYVAPVVRQFDEYAFDQAAPLTADAGRTFVFENTVRANWKTYFENACVNVLHENFVHDEYNRSPKHPRIAGDGEKTFFEIIDGYLLGLGYQYSNFVETYGPVDGPHLGSGDDLPDKSTFATLYPNFYLAIAPNYVEAGLALPIDVDRTSDRRIYLMHRDAAAAAADTREHEQILALYDIAQKEDGRVCEAVQKARQSPVYSQKFYSPFWDELHYRFNQFLIDDLDD